MTGTVPIQNGVDYHGAYRHGPFLKFKNQIHNRHSIFFHKILIESQFHSSEFKGYAPRAPEPSCPSSSLLQERTYQTFTDEDLFDEESVEYVAR